MQPVAIAALEQRLAEARAAEAFRQRRCRKGSPPRPTVDGRHVINFAANDYLGLAADPRVIDAHRRGTERYGVGAGASELVSGHTDAHEELESALARFTGRSRALVFSTGYMANLGVVSVLASRRTAVIEDRLNHASLLDAAVLARSRLRRYRHVDLYELAARLATNSGAVVITDGVFSMDGDLAPLPGIAQLCRAHGATLIVDDAHGFGVLGEHGAGTVEHFGLAPVEVPVLVGTFGKAFGGAGAFVVGDEVIIEALIQFARPYIYTTALPPAICCAMTTALQIVQAEPGLQARLHGNIHHFRARAGARGIPLMQSVTAIQPVILGRNGRVAAVAERLLAQGFWVAAIRPPTVPAGSARLRIAISAAHAVEEIDALVDAVAAAI